MGTVYKETYTTALPAGARIIVRKGEQLDRAGVLAEYMGLELTKRKVK
jgi:hypothetical protein